VLSTQTRFATAFAALLLISRQGATQTPEPANAAELAGALQRKYETVRDFSAEFIQTYRGGVLNRQIRDTGTVVIRKPGRMRWDYKTPEEKLFVSDGVKIYWYVPKDKQVVESLVPPGDQANSPALFLAGKGNITRDFTASLAERPEGQAPGALALKLVPRTAQAEYDWLIIVVDPISLALRGLVTGDSQGGTSSFSFTNLKENVGPADKLFTFVPPRGVEVVTDSSRR
jgi:outer membrane lipoprotein carrier protein